MKYRHELKYYIPNTDIPVLKELLSTVTTTDPHQRDSGYTISSLYFDTIFNLFYDENNAGTNIRDKIRIRKYNGENRTLKLEIKSKVNSLCLKRSIVITEKDCKKLMEFPYCFEQPELDTLLHEVIAMNQTHCLKPAVIIEYDRYAMIHPIGNVRITFDQNIRASSFITSFLDNQYQCVPVIENDLSILEVKYDEILPNYIAQYLDHFQLTQTAFSKYYLGRKTLNI